MEFKITDYGASPSNSDIQNDSALAQCLNAVAANGGGRIIQPAGKYLVAQGWTGTGAQWSNVILEGEGDATQLVSTSTSNNVVSVLGNASTYAVNFAARDFAITANNRTTGTAVYISYGARTSISGIKTDPLETTRYNLGTGIHLDKFDDVDISNVVGSTNTTGLLLNGDSSGNWGADCYIHSGNKFTSNKVATFVPGQVGIRIAGGCGGITIDDTDLIYNDNGIVIDKSIAGITNREIFLKSGLFVDSNGSDGIQAASGSFGTLQMHGTWVASNGIRTGGFPNGNGVNIAPSQASTAEIVATGVRIFNNRGTGFAASGGNLTMGNANITDNGQDTTNGGDGIGIYNSGVNFKIDAHATRNGIGGPNARGNGLYIPGGAQYFAVYGRYWANGHRNIYDNSGAVTKLISALS